MTPLYTEEADLVQFITNFNGAGEVVLTTVTPVVLRRYDVATGRIKNPFEEVLKIQGVRVLLNAPYEFRVNQNRRIEGKKDDFVVENLKWGVCGDNVMVVHKGQLYVKTIEVAKVDRPMYMHKGVGVTFDEIKEFMPTPHPSPKQNLDEEVKVRTFHIENIISLEVGDQLVYEKT